MSTSEELNESELGTQVYWNNRYKSEIENFQTHGDIGDVWFGEASMNRVCRWIYKNTTTLIHKQSAILDLGCGNGAFLLELATHSYDNLTGVDYSEHAVALAKQIAEKKQLCISYKVFDILDDNISLRQMYDLIHDKGTYDAISLSTNAQTKRQIYISKVYNMLQQEGLFIITSCNWTQAELETHFTSEHKFIVFYVIPTPVFQFGGQTGNSVVSIVFKKINEFK